MSRLVRSITLLTALLLIGCGGTSSPTLEAFTNTTYAPRHASGFEILSAPGCASTLLRIDTPWQGGKNNQQRLLILRDDETVPDGFSGTVVKAPLRRVVCMSSSHVAMFDALGQIRRVIGVSGIGYISNEYVNEHKLCGEVRDVGYDSNLNFELLAAMQPDLILLYGVWGEDTLVTGKLRELGIPYIYIGDYAEESPLGKAEWLMAIAEMTDCVPAANEYLDNLFNRYETLKQQAKSSAPAPNVMLNTPYRDTWFMPSSRSYIVRLVEDAGGKYIYPQNDSGTSVPIDAEQAYLLTEQADIWLNVGALNTMAELCGQNPRFAKTPAVRAGRVYNNNNRQTPDGGSDFWESGVMRPDRVLEDLIRIFQGESEDLYYYKQLR